ncbi:DUF3987 domain-containing protein [Xylanibacter oryzae]|uniref:DUF3987 domain-containing protein n=1 Tax=Xylanibacter oryzae TaxID=185293 RepID=UPI0004AD5021|nr:DUF3987 domain-containing protein [Xylanibacter oryzae]
MFDIVSRFNSKPILCTKEILHNTLCSQVVVQTCREIADIVKTKIEEVERQIAATTEPGDLAALEKDEKALWDEVARLKKRLPAFCFQAHYTDGKRHNTSAEESGFCMFDVDDLDDPKATFGETAEKIKGIGVVLAHITPSTRGLRYVFRTPKGMTIAQAQLWFAGQLGIEQYDGCTKDLARISFAVPEAYVLMIDEERLFGENENQHTETKTVDERAEAKQQKNDVKPKKSLKSQVSTEKTASECVESAKEMVDEPNFKGIPFKLIIDRLLLAQGVDGEPAEGERNTTLYNLVRQLRYICDFSQSRLMQVVPRWGMSEEEVAQTVQSALSTVRRTELPPHLGQTLRLLTSQQMEMNAATADAAAGIEQADAKIIVPSSANDKTPPLPEHLPRLLDLLTKSYPQEYRAAILMSAMPILGTLATRARARYFDGAEHLLSFLTCIVAPQASGKSCTRKLVDMLLGRLQKQDNDEREKERRWMEEKKARKNSKQQPEDPRAKIRIVPATISNAMLFKRLDCSESEHLFTYAEEIDTLSKGRKSGAWSQKDDIMRQAFDNSICGQDYMSDNSWSAMVKVFYNTLTCGTPVAVHRYYNDVEGGLVSRVCFSQLPDMLGAQMPIFGRLTKDEEAEVAKWVEKLMALGRETPEKESEAIGNADEPDNASGKLPQSDPVEFDIPRVKQAIWGWLEARRLEYLETQENPALDIFRRRSAVIGFRAGLLAVLLSDEEETDEAIEFATWVASYALAEQLDLFGEEMNHLMMEGESLCSAKEKTTYYQPLLGSLPDEFTVEQLVLLRMQAGYKSPVKQVLWRWKQNGLVEKIGKNKFKKLQWK